jgi:hypothetical protein
MQDLLALRLADPILAPPGLKTRGKWLSPTLLMIVIAADAPRKKRAAIALGNPFRNQGTTTTRSVRMSGADSPKSEVSFCGTQARSSETPAKYDSACSAAAAWHHQGARFRANCRCHKKAILGCTTLMFWGASSLQADFDKRDAAWKKMLADGEVRILLSPQDSRRVLSFPNPVRLACSTRKARMCHVVHCWCSTTASWATAFEV